jgi:hypothetical protein
MRLTTFHMAPSLPRIRVPYAINEADFVGDGRITRVFRFVDYFDLDLDLDLDFVGHFLAATVRCLSDLGTHVPVLRG